MALFPSDFASDLELKRFRRPTTLKDFLLISSSSNGFISFPRRSGTSTVRKLLEIDLSAGDSSKERRLCRSRSNTSSVLLRVSETIINAVKHLPFYSVRSPPAGPKQGIFLPRSLSKRLRGSFWKKGKECTEREAKIVVKDVTRFEHEEEENQKERTLDFSSGMSSARSSNCGVQDDSALESMQSWSGSSEYSGDSDGLYGNKRDLQWSRRRKRAGVGADSPDQEPKVLGSKGECACTYEEKEQLSPVSVLDLHPYQDEESPSSSLPISEGAKKEIHEKLGRFEIMSRMVPTNLDKQMYQSGLEEEEEVDDRVKATDRARDLLKCFNVRYGEAQKWTLSINQLMSDFFREGLVESRTNRTRLVKEEEESMSEEVLLRARSSWMNGNGGMRLGVEENRLAYVKGMEEDGKWRSSALEEEELVLEMETCIFRSLLKELILDLGTMGPTQNKDEQKD